jgi:hypothetical protein
MKIVIFLVVLSSCILSQDLNFIREDITFNLDTACFKVEGFYWFHNSSSEETGQLIYYPFPVSDKKGIIDSVDVIDITASIRRNIVDLTDNGFYFFVSLPPQDTGLYRITYRQKLYADSAVYILRSTASWGKPLESAEFKLIVNNPELVKSFSYSPDTTYNIEDKIIYYWKRDNFMPEKDMVFHFRRK